MNNIPENIKEKINEEVEVRYPDFKSTSQEMDFRSGCEVGYSLAQQEITRLKVLIEKEVKSNAYNQLSNSSVYNQKHALVICERCWENFKQIHNL